nr:XRE family transcriptional regulator [Limosilactobacillus mucosae]
MSEFSERLTNLRENKGWSKTYVAKTIGLSSMQTYANWEYGRTEPDFETTKKLANLFNVSTDYLLGREPSDKSDIDLDKAIDESRSFDGKPISDHDREVVKKILRGYFN